MKYRIFIQITLSLLVFFCPFTTVSYGQKPLKKPTLAVTAKKSLSRTPQPPSRKSVSKNSFVNGHEFVDLGLSVKWATCNVGAHRPEEYGDYFAWGEIAPKSEYVSGNCATYDKKMFSISGKSRYDAASAKWGAPVRIPTKKEFEELQSHCKTTWTTRKGVRGRLVTSKKNGKSIFLPAAGFRYGKLLKNLGEEGGYWSSMPYEYSVNDSYFFSFNRDGLIWYWGNRYKGRSVRPVLD